MASDARTAVAVFKAEAAALRRRAPLIYRTSLRQDVLPLRPLPP